MPYREETRKVLEITQEKLSEQNADAALLGMVQALIAEEQMGNADVIMERLKQWPPKEGEDESA